MTHVIERREEGPSMRVHLEYQEGHEGSESFLAEMTEACPGAKITSEALTDEVFELTINDKVVYSMRLLKKYPDFEEMLEIAKWMNKGKSYMHMYLCSFMEGGEPRMVVADRKATPLAKRLILACTIQ